VSTPASRAPPGAALGHPAPTNPAAPARIRRLLTVESGLTDGIATPFVFLALALSATEATGGTGGLVAAITDIAIGVAVGVVAGFAGGVLLRLADRSHWASAVSDSSSCLPWRAAGPWR
jgi:NhaP-type Na+/H+ or K+/H+ antiporter